MADGNGTTEPRVGDCDFVVVVATAPAAETDAAVAAGFDPVIDIVFGSILILFSIVATIGNATVIYVFMKESVLRTTTNYFLMSLAFSDLLVGVLVMPFGIIERLNYGRWLFGRDLCDIWHAVDVMSCTASIMNLCCIAIERYQAIHDPIKYPLRPNKTRVYIGILIAWLCSAAISFPAIAWWRMTDRHKWSAQSTSNSTDTELQLHQPGAEELPTAVCEFTSDSAYLMASSMVSFYVPTACMLVLYYRIYRTAITVSRSFATGERSVALARRAAPPGHATSGAASAHGAGDSLHSSGSLVLRVHRGKSGCNRAVPLSNNTTTTATYATTLSVRPTNCPYRHTHNNNNNNNNNSNNNNNNNNSRIVRDREQETTMDAGIARTPDEADAQSTRTLAHQASVSSQDSDMNVNMNMNVNVSVNVNANCKKVASSSMPTIRSMAVNTIVEMAGRSGAASTRLHMLRKVQGFMTLKQQFKRFAREQKAAKTLGLIIFLFIACWGPFFLCNLLIALQQLALIGVLVPEHTLPMLLLCVTWLGYANSCINCFAYPCAMREFRRAIYKHVGLPLRKKLRLRLPPFTLALQRNQNAFAFSALPRGERGGASAAFAYSASSIAVAAGAGAACTTISSVRTRQAASGSARSRFNANDRNDDASASIDTEDPPPLVSDGLQLLRVPTIGSSSPAKATASAKTALANATNTAALMAVTSRQQDDSAAAAAIDGQKRIEANGTGVDDAPMSLGLANSVHCAATITGSLVLPLPLPCSRAEVSRRLLAEVMNMNGSLV